MTANHGEIPTRPDYPLEITGRLDPGQSRWLWLVKWLLAIPHFIVLVFLWIAVAVLTVVAGVSILIRGVYPRSIFDFNVGVMRWTWRVSFYTVGVFGTDRYPPFRLASDPDYPADLQVRYPQSLSRGLVLVKWWLLAIPQYIVVAILAGGWGSGWNDSARGGGGPGLIQVLAIIAAFTLLFTAAYPKPLFDLIMGLNRWSWRVVAYAALMTDEYPPFRLDQGSGEAPPATPTAVPGIDPVPGAPVPS